MRKHSLKFNKHFHSSKKNSGRKEPFLSFLKEEIAPSTCSGRSDFPLIDSTSSACVESHTPINATTEPNEEDMFFHLQFSTSRIYTVNQMKITISSPIFGIWRKHSSCLDNAMNHTVISIGISVPNPSRARPLTYCQFTYFEGMKCLIDLGGNQTRN